MSQIFRHSTNTFTRITIFGAVFIVAFLGWVVTELSRSSYATRAEQAREQPVPFSHAHHVGGLGLDCRYCHASVELSAHAGFPSTHTCMTCHSQVWTHAPVLEPVRKSYEENRPLRWSRVYRLPEYVYFDHSVHV